MSDRVRWIEHKGKKILYTDYSGLSGEEYVQVKKETNSELFKYAPGSVVTLSNVANSCITAKAREKPQEFNEQTRGMSKAAAAVGVTSVKKVIARFIKKCLYFANSLEDAKEWLVEQANK